MAPLTDLTWKQVNTALKARLNTSNDLIDLDAYGNPATIDIGSIVQDFPKIGSDAAGVLKFMAIMLDACRDAQATANASQPVGEKLNAFANPVTAAPQGTLVPIARTMNTRADLTSVSRIIGTNV